VIIVANDWYYYNKAAFLFDNRKACEEFKSGQTILEDYIIYTGFSKC